MTNFDSDKVKAIATLLEDPSEDIQYLMEAQLVKFTMPELRELREKISEINLDMAFHLDDLLQQKTLASFVNELEHLASSGKHDLETLVCFISRFIENDLTDEMILLELEQLAAKCKEHIAKSVDSTPEEALIEYLRVVPMVLRFGQCSNTFSYNEGSVLTF